MSEFNTHPHNPDEPEFDLGPTGMDEIDLDQGPDEQEMALFDKVGELLEKAISIDRQQKELLNTLLEISANTPEMGLPLETLEQLKDQLEQERTKLNPEDPHFEEVLAKKDRVQELFTLLQHQDPEHPTHLSETIRKMQELEREKQQLLYQANLQLGRRKPQITDPKEQLKHSLYPTENSAKN